jgi:serine/threonine protein kinase
MTLAAGNVLANRYRLVAPIGRGGSSVVWIGEHVVTQKRVALKVLKTREKEKGTRFVREAKIAARLEHPNVVRAYDVFQLEEDGALVMVMDLLEGESLGARLKRVGTLDLHEAARLVFAITSALEAAHALGIVHRDLKPENVFLIDDHSIKVLDFGIAKWKTIEGGAEHTQQITETGALIGTPHYMAPEQAFGEKDVDARADVWALGVILYECLSSKKPIEGENFGQIFKAIAFGDIAPIANIVPTLSPDIAAMITAMLSKDRAARPAFDQIRVAFAPYADATSKWAAASAQSVAPVLRKGSRNSVVLAATLAVIAMGGGWFAMSRVGPSSIVTSIAPPSPASIASPAPAVASSSAPSSSAREDATSASGDPSRASALASSRTDPSAPPIKRLAASGDARAKPIAPVVSSSPDLPGHVHARSPY